MSASMPGAPRRPLFLGTHLAARIDTDGPALRVRSAGKPVVRFPLARVSRVVAGGRTDWQADALRACFKGGIPVVFVDDDGALTGSLHPARLRTSRFADNIEELLERPDWREIYDCWLRAARMRVLAGWRDARRDSGMPPAPGVFEELVRRHVHCAATHAPSGAPAGRWCGAVAALAAEALARAGAQPVHWACRGEPLQLHRDLSGLLGLRVLLHVGEAMASGLEGEAAELRAFHALSGALEHDAARWLGALARRVSQVLAEWR